MAAEEKVGTVIQKRFGAGTKSEHDAVWLDGGDKQYVLRRAGGNPFSDPELDKLVGKRIRAHGYTLNNNSFILQDWQEL